MMTDAEYDKLKDKIRALAEKWVKPLGLNQWKIDLTYKREGLATTEDNARENWGVAARTPVLWQYLSASIEFNMPYLAEFSDEDLEYIFVHELMHIFLNEMREEGIKHEERTATTLAWAFIWLRAHCEKKPDDQLGET
ncbi:MAG: hypothetical protein WBV94_09085 [Blastocatellia bacterium]